MIYFPMDFSFQQPSILFPTYHFPTHLFLLSHLCNIITPTFFPIHLPGLLFPTRITCPVRNTVPSPLPAQHRSGFTMNKTLLHYGTNEPVLHHSTMLHTPSLWRNVTTHAILLEECTTLCIIYVYPPKTPNKTSNTIKIHVESIP